MNKLLILILLFSSNAFATFIVPPQPLVKGGTGTAAASANAAFNALSPMTTLGDLIFENSTPAGARLAGNTTSSKKFLSQTGTGSVSAAPVWSLLVGSDLPNPSSSTLGGVESIAAVTHNFLTAISTSGVPSQAQPAFSDISGTATVAQTTVSTQAISASNIDWSTGSLFTKTLSANTTFTFSNQTSGQTIVVRLTNTASNYTVTWPGTVKWPGQTAPTETIGAFSDVITCVYDGTTTYCNSVQNF